MPMCARRMKERKVDGAAIMTPEMAPALSRPKNQQTRVPIILEFRNPNRILAKEFSGRG